jgi:tyrosinase
MYLYFFERIVRSAAHEANSSRLGIPYWNWSKDDTLPEAFREEVNGSQDNNALYWGVRRQSVTASSNAISISSLGLQNRVDVTALLNEPGFDADLEPATMIGFNSGVEDGPHGFIHMLVAARESDGSWRGMGIFEEAARDPVFWSHHCNIDRLWSHWRQKADHSEPVAAEIQLANERIAWSDVRHTFVDESGNEIVLTNGQVLLAAKILDKGYVFDDLPQEAIVAGSDLEGFAPMSASSPKIFKQEAPIQTLATAGHVEVARMRKDVTLEPMEAAVAPGPTTKQTLIIRDIAASAGIQDSIFDVYVNLPPNEKPNTNSPYYVGGINIFNALGASRQMLPPGSTKAGGAAKHQKHGGAETRLPISDALARQGWKQGDPIKVTIVPVPLDNRPAEPSTTAQPPEAALPPTLSIGEFELIGQ